MSAIDLKIKHHFRKGANGKDNAYGKEMHLPAGHFAQSHKHNFDHFAFVTEGTCTVDVAGVMTTLVGPDFILIEADTVHTITAATDTTWYCLHKTDCTDPDLIDHTLIK